MSTVTDRRSEERKAVSWFVRISSHRGFAREEKNGNGAGEAVVEDLGRGGVRLLSSEYFGRGQLVELELVCPCRKQPERGRRSVVVGKIAWARKVPRNGVPGPAIMSKRAVARLGVRFLSADRTALEWVEESLRRYREAASGNGEAADREQ